MKGDKAGQSGESSSGDIFSAHAFDLDIKLGQVMLVLVHLCHEQKHKYLFKSH